MVYRIINSKIKGTELSEIFNIEIHRNNKKVELEELKEIIYVTNKHKQEALCIYIKVKSGWIIYGNHGNKEYSYGIQNGKCVKMDIVLVKRMLDL